MTIADALHSVKTVVVHANCSDGLASAILIHDVLPKAEVQFIQYNTEPHKALTPQPGFLFCDFSPFAETEEIEGENGVAKRALTESGKSQIQAWVEAGALVLDHHATVKDLGLIQPFLDAGQGAFGDEKADPGVCGAVLAFRHVWLPLKTLKAKKGLGLEEDLKACALQAENFATLAGIRDTWQKDSVRWREACTQGEMLRFYPPENWLSCVEPFHYRNRGWWDERMALGKLLIEKHEKTVTRVIEKAYRFTTPKGTRVAVFSGAHLSSDASEALGQEADLVIGFAYEVENGTPKLICSNRSRGTYPVRVFAESLGGGGHKNAAGFSCTLGGIELNPYAHIKQLVEAFETPKTT